MKTLALLVLLAAPCLSAPAHETIAHSKTLLKNQDLEGALRDAEDAVAHGGGADAYAARADAKFALGRPIDEVIADYGEAAKLDARYAVKYKGLIAQRDSERGRKVETGGVPLGNGANGLAMTLAATAIGCLLFVIFLVMVNSREGPAAPPDGEEPKKEPPKEDA